MGLMKKLTSAVVASSLVLGLMGTAIAAPTVEQVDGAFGRLAAYDLAKGRLMADGSIDPALGETITRAELATLIVRGFGQDATAQLLKGAHSFGDVDANEWYSGYVAMVKSLAAQGGIPVGYEDGSFRPDQPVTAVEALAFIMKVLGVQPGTGATWVEDTISIAQANGIITEADAAALLDAPNDPANRGLSFAIVDSVFATAKVGGDKSIYRTYVDNVAPELTVNAPAEPAVTAAKATITGSVKNAVALYHGSDAITVDEDGNFTLEVDLKVGANEFTFTAVDLVGNTTERSYKVTRNVGAATNVAVEIAGEIVAGSETEMTIKVTDASGAELEVAADDITVTIGGAIGTYADGKFTASTKVGTGTITATVGELTSEAVDVKVVAGALAKVEAETASVAPGKSVKLLAKDAHGNAIEGALFTENDTYAFIDGDIFTATKAGQYEVTARIADLTATGTVGVYGAVEELAIEGPETIVANGATYYTFTVKAVDESGNLVGDAKGTVELDTSLDIKGGGDKEATMKNGVATFELRAAAGLVDLDIVIDASMTIGVDDFTGSTSVAAVAQVPTSIKVEAPEYLPTANMNGVSVKVTVLDQLGKAVQDSAWEFDVKVSGAASLDADKEVSSASEDLVSGESFTVYPRFVGDAGTANITVTYPGLASGSGTIKAAVPLAASKLVLKTSDDTTLSVSDAEDDDAVKSVEYKIQLVDRNGVPTTAADDVTAKLTFGDVASKGNLFVSLYEYDSVEEEWAWEDFTKLNADPAPTTVVVDGATGIGKFRVASKQADTLTVKASDDAKKLTESAAISMTFEAGKAKYVSFASENTYVVRSAGKATVTAQLYDAFGNKVPKSGVEIKFVDTTGDYDGITLNGKAAAAKVSTDANGAATVELTMRDYVDDVTVAVSSDAEGINNSDAATNLPVGGLTVARETSVVPATVLPNSITVSVVDANGNAVSSRDAGLDVYLKIGVKDNYSRWIKPNLAGNDPIVGEDWEFEFDSSNDDLSFSGATFTADGNYYVYGPITVKKAETLTFSVELPSLGHAVEASKAIAVRAGTVAGVEVVEAGSKDFDTDSDFDGTYEFSTSKVNELTLRLTDAYGNAVTSSKVTSSFSIEWSGDSGVEVRDANGIKYDATAGADAKLITFKKSSTTLKVYVVAPAKDAKVVFTGDDFSFTVNP